MTVTSTHSPHLLKRLGVLAVMGVGATLVGLGASGVAAADSFDLPPLPAPADAEYDLWIPTPPQPELPWVAGPPAGLRLGEDVGLNPQPLPPRTEFGDSVSLNPQPLPPGPDRGRRVALNPQPLPPAPDWHLPFLQLPVF